MRRLFVEHARDVQRRREREEELPESMEETAAEKMVRESDARVAEASAAFDGERLETELLRRVLKPETPDPTQISSNNID